MRENDIHDVVLTELAAIAPEIDIAGLSSSQLLRNQIDLDSFDWLRFLVSLNQRLKVVIPEADYSQLTSVDRLVDYLSTKMRDG